MIVKVWAFMGTHGKHRIQHVRGMELGSQLRKGQEEGKVPEEACKEPGMSVEDRTERRGLLSRALRRTPKPGPEKTDACNSPQVSGANLRVATGSGARDPIG